MNTKKVETVKKIIGDLLIAAGAFGGLYIGGWMMFIKPIIEVCDALDSGALTGLIVVGTVLKCLFASVIGGIITGVGCLVGSLVKDW